MCHAHTWLAWPAWPRWLLQPPGGFGGRSGQVEIFWPRFWFWTPFWKDRWHYTYRKCKQDWISIRWQIVYKFLWSCQFINGLKRLAPTVFTDLGEIRRQQEKTRLSTFEKCSSSLATNLPKCKQGWIKHKAANSMFILPIYTSSSSCQFIDGSW